MKLKSNRTYHNNSPKISEDWKSEIGKNKLSPLVFIILKRNETAHAFVAHVRSDDDDRSNYVCVNGPLPDPMKVNNESCRPSPLLQNKSTLFSSI